MLDALRDYTRGLRTQAEVARELGISIRQLQRIEDEVMALWLLTIARAMREAIDDFSSEPRLPRRFACRISEGSAESDHVAPRAVAHQDSLSSTAGGKQRVGLPRRFRSKP